MAPTSTPAAPQSRQHVILLADDEDAVRRALTRTLESAGYRVEQASDGAQAIAMIRDRRFDAIVSDIAMPGATGLTLLRTVRQSELDVPVVLMTGAPTVTSAAEAVEYGALRYLVKPFEGELLIAAVQEAVRLHEIAKLKRQAMRLLQDEQRGLGDQAALTKRFEHALGSIRMAYQPIVSTTQRSVFGYEALLRCDEKSLVDPLSLVIAAERLGRLDDLGRAVRRNVADVVAGAPAQFVFVNLHSRDLLDEELYAAESPLSRIATRVVLEITERASLEELNDLQPRVEKLRKLGFRVAVDDLGAGYAGLTSFIRLKPDVVKFDMSLVRGIDADPARKRLLASMISAFREMSVTTVAEGVETPAERKALVESGCDTLQGFLFAKPGPPFPEVAWG
jgi:EAL domain-containing protein (putative c-di-GMP-specific phosphodiesterase class I)